MSSI
jgi:hypothetical protein